MRHDTPIEQVGKYSEDLAKCGLQLLDIKKDPETSDILLSVLDHEGNKAVLRNGEVLRHDIDTQLEDIIPLLPHRFLRYFSTECESETLYKAITLRQPNEEDMWRWKDSIENYQPLRAVYLDKEYPFTESNSQYREMLESAIMSEDPKLKKMHYVGFNELQRLGLKPYMDPEPLGFYEMRFDPQGTPILYVGTQDRKNIYFTSDLQVFSRDKRCKQTSPESIPKHVELPDCVFLGNFSCRYTGYIKSLYRYKDRVFSTRLGQEFKRFKPYNVGTTETDPVTDLITPKAYLARMRQWHAIARDKGYEYLGQYSTDMYTLVVLRPLDATDTTENTETTETTDTTMCSKIHEANIGDPSTVSVLYSNFLKKCF